MAGYAAGTHTQELIDVAPTQASDGQALSQPSSGQVADETRPTPDPNVTPTMTPEQKEDQEQKKQVKYLKYAAKMAAGYDYDGAIEYLKSYGDDYLKLDKFTAAIADYEAKKAECQAFFDSWNSGYSALPSLYHSPNPDKQFFHTLFLLFCERHFS